MRHMSSLVELSSIGNLTCGSVAVSTVDDDVVVKVKWMKKKERFMRNGSPSNTSNRTSKCSNNSICTK